MKPHPEAGRNGCWVFSHILTSTFESLGSWLSSGVTVAILEAGARLSTSTFVQFFPFDESLVLLSNLILAFKMGSKKKRRKGQLICMFQSFLWEHAELLLWGDCRRDPACDQICQAVTVLQWVLGEIKSQAINNICVLRELSACSTIMGKFVCMCIGTTCLGLGRRILDLNPGWRDDL